jgi:hypothetical protein
VKKSAKKQQKKEPKDPALDVPSEANREKHINFLEEEEKSSQFVGGVDTQSEKDNERKKEWERGIEAGKQQNPNE